MFPGPPKFAGEFRERSCDPVSFLFCQLDPVDFPVRQAVFVNAIECQVNIKVRRAPDKDSGYEPHPLIDIRYPALGLPVPWLVSVGTEPGFRNFIVN